MKRKNAYSVDEVISAIYRAALGREPDDEGLKHFQKLLTNQPEKLTLVADGIFGSDEHQSAFNNRSGFSDHSQFGEMSQLVKLIVNSATKYKSVVDVGARGKVGSNSYDLLTQFGWQGLLVEANPSLHDDIASDFAGTRFALAKCAIGPKEGKMPFYIGANDDVSSLKKDAAEGWGDLKGEIEVEVRRLHKVLSHYKIPNDFDVLNLDIEGLDIEVLNDLITSSSYRPTYIIIEASYDFATKTLADAGCNDSVQKSYKIVAQTKANLILKKNNSISIQ